MSGTERARRWVAVERPGGTVDRRALLGLRSSDPATPRAFPRPGITDGCTGCGTCVRVCPTGALTEARLPTTVVIGVRPTACNGCGECVLRCPETVLAPAVTLPGQEFPVRLARVRIDRCTGCGARLNPGEDGVCSGCSARRSMIDDVWSRVGL